jgi:3-hydroxybutyrate dehydrogenase
MLNGFGDRAQIAALQRDLSARYGVQVGYSPADLLRRDEITALVEQTRRELGSVDILVNNAGVQHVAPVESFPDDQWTKIIALNLSSAFHATKDCLPHMKAAGWGRIVNIASAHGLVASVHKSAYVAAKHGLVGLTKVVSLETAQTRITCNAICPGWVRTPLVEAQIEAKAKAKALTIPAATAELLGEKQPSLRFTQVDQLGALVVFLCSEAASNLTGTAIPVDGGWTAQ